LLACDYRDTFEVLKLMKSARMNVDDDYVAELVEVSNPHLVLIVLT